MADVMVTERTALMLLPQTIGPVVREGIAIGPRRRESAAPAGPQTPVWLTTTCGRRYAISQIGSMFGRE